MKKIMGIVVLLAITVALSVFAETTTNYVGSASVLSADGLDKVYVVENTVTFGSTVSNDVFLCVAVPAKHMVLAATVEVLTTNSNGSATFALGDAGSATQYDASTDMNATSVTTSPASAWEYYTSASDIRLTTLAAITGGTARVRAVIADLSK